MLKGTEPAWKAIFSWQMAAALIGVAAVGWFSLGNPERSTMVSGEVDDAKLPDMIYCKEQVLTDVANMPPSMLYRQGKVDDALREAKAIYKANPADIKALMCYGNIFCQAGEPKEDGFECLRKAIALAPHSRYVRLNYARQLAAGNRYEESIPQYEMLIKAFPDGWTAPKAELADIYIESKQYDKAVEQFKSLLADPANATNGAMRKSQGVAIADNGETDEGFDEFLRGARMEQAQGFSPQAQQAIDEAGGSAEAAVAKLQQQIAEQPDSSVPLLLVLAQIELGLNQPEEAKRLLLDAKQKEDSNPEVHRWLCQVLDKQSDAEGARAEFKIATEMDLHPPE